MGEAEEGLGRGNAERGLLQMDEAARVADELGLFCSFAGVGEAKMRVDGKGADAQLVWGEGRLGAGVATGHIPLAEHTGE